MISPTWPEPRLDVTAQLAALLDPEHPKDTVWLASGTPVPAIDAPDIVRVDHPAGVLLTTDADKASRFAAEPSDDTLADILGYVEPKGAVTGEPVVVQARAPSGGVVLEMGCSPGALDLALDRAKAHGAVFVLPLSAAMLRRAVLYLRGL